ncbi:MAG: helix-turn-helix domain-containing protein [Sandaracinaceae bacterium]|nr:helix-turn-helix domain-containing protein [Sandaracinaceae bacterium]
MGGSAGEPRAVEPQPELPSRLADNVRQLRQLRGKTQQQMAKLAGVPRATWANLESGSANPTLSVLHRAATALGVSLEELLAPPRASARHYPRSSIQVRQRGTVQVHQLRPDPVPGVAIERMELPPGARMAGTPHTPGTREYLTCERGRIVLIASGDRFTLEPGDVVAFRGDQRHSYHNEDSARAVGYSVVLLVSPLVGE